MTALSVNPPYPIFTETDGQPLEDGYIWIGTANLDPQGNPINVYWDAALTQLAGQPIRTQGGYPVNSGTPARLYVNSDYSIRVMNKNGSTVYSAPTKTDAIGEISSAIVSFIQAGTGAVTRTAQSKMREIFSVLDFGAIGDGVADDTAAIQAAIDACPVGGTLTGLGLTFLSTGVQVNSAITIDGVNILLAPDGTAAQDAFTIASDDVTLLNCGATITQAALPLSNTSAGVYSDGYDRIVIDGGTWDGSIDNIYAPGFYRGVIFIKDGEDCVVKNTITKNAGGEGLWMFTCTRPQVLNNKAYNAGGSEIVCGGDGALVDGNLIVGNNVGGNSGLATGGQVVVTNNVVLNASGWGIAHGEGGGGGGLISNNYIVGYGQFNIPGTNFSGILSQGANGLVVENNYVGAPFAGEVAFGIQFVNAPVQFTCKNNLIEGTTAQGIYVFDAAGIAQAIISGNLIRNPLSYHIFVGNVNQLVIQDNVLTNAYLSGSFDFFVYLDFPTATPNFIRIIDNVMDSATLNYDICVYVNSLLSSSTQYIQHGNYFDNWTSQPYSSGRNCNYDVRNDNYAVSPKSGLVTLTNGGTTTVVTSAQVSAKSVVLLEIGNAAAATLNPVYRISAIADGSFTITHTAGTVAGEQLKWTII